MHFWHIFTKKKKKRKKAACFTALSPNYSLQHVSVEYAIAAIKFLLFFAFLATNNPRFPICCLLGWLCSSYEGQQSQVWTQIFDSDPCIKGKHLFFLQRKHWVCPRLLCAYPPKETRHWSTSVQIFSVLPFSLLPSLQSAILLTLTLGACLSQGFPETLLRPIKHPKECLYVLL